MQGLCARWIARTIGGHVTDKHSGRATDTLGSPGAETADDDSDAGIRVFLDHIDGIDCENRWSARFETTYPQFHNEETPFIAPLVFELGDIRSLLASWAYVQSAMSITDPFRLVLDYTRAMMGFLLFNPSPKTIEIIGLGGGSLAKYCHKFLPGASIRGVEIDPDVIAVANQFHMPPSSGRFEIIWADGSKFVAQDEQRTDILLVDGFDTGGKPARLCSPEFYQHCRTRLTPGGILVANLCDHAWKHGIILSHIRDCFGEVIVVPVEAGMNQVVFAFESGCPRIDYEKLREVARQLDQTHTLSLARLAEDIISALQPAEESSFCDTWRHLT
jgi:spermidine synthase